MVKNNGTQSNLANGNQNYPRFKVVFLGSNATGKTNLINKIMKKNNNPNYIPTLGVDVSILPVNTTRGCIILDLWDTAGFNGNHSGLQDGYFIGANMGVLCMDPQDNTTTVEESTWYQVNPGKMLMSITVNGGQFQNIQGVVNIDVSNHNDIRLLLTNILYALTHDPSIQIISY
jgi:GTPase SAR1 family protein